MGLHITDSLALSTVKADEYPAPGRGRGSNIDDLFGHSTTVVDQKSQNIDFLHWLEHAHIGGVDRAGREGMYSITGEQHVGFKDDDISINFQYGISTHDVKNGGSVTGTGAKGTFKSTATMETGPGIGSATLESKDAIRYRAGHECFAEISWIFATPAANVNQYAGFKNSADGWCAGYKGLDFGLWFIEGGNVNFIKQADFNVDKMDGSGESGYLVIPQKANLYRLSYGWHGFLPLILEVKVGTVWRKAHEQVFTNVATETHLENPNLPIAGVIERTAGTGASLKMYTGSWRGGSVAGPKETSNADRWFAVTKLDATVAASPTNTNIFTIRNKAIYNGKSNHILVELAVVTFDSTLNKTVAVYGTKNATLSGTTWTSVDSVNSVVEYNMGGTVTGGQRGPATVIKAGGDRRTDVRGTGIKIHPGDALTFEVSPGGTVNGAFSISARFVEYH